MKNEDVYYEAMKARDPRFDGKFFVGVKTTGIYCRPICPARPLRKNVEFFENHLSAERAGYRPCLRCRPESAPRSPAWIGKSAIVQRAVRKLQSQTPKGFSEEAFAKHFGVSARHLRRLFMEEIGKTPKQIDLENRLDLSRKLLTETDLSISEIAFASGFSSIRRFNESFKQRFKKAPSNQRRALSKDPNWIQIALPYRPPFDFEGLYHSYSRHQIGHLESFSDMVMTRVFKFGDDVGEVRISNEPEKTRLKVQINHCNTAHLHLIVQRVRDMFDIDSDPVLIANTLESVPKLKKILKIHPGIRLPSGWDAFEIAVGTILGQLVSVDRAKALLNDLIELTGEDSGRVLDGYAVKFFPTPQALAIADLSQLKTTGRRKQTLKAFAQALVDQKLSLDPYQDVESFRTQLLEISGIGPWTADYMSMKVLRHTDSFPATDLILARAIEDYEPDTLERMRPWRAYAAALLWRGHQSPKTLKKKVQHENAT